jgi:hypothetical protein
VDFKGLDHDGMSDLLVADLGSFDCEQTLAERGPNAE